MTRPALPDLYGYILASWPPAAAPTAAPARAGRSRDVACFDRRCAFVMDALADFAAEGYVADDDLFEDDA